MENISNEKSSVPKRKLMLIAIWVSILIVWLGLVALGFMDPTLDVWLVAVTGVAILTEIAFWTTALIFGVSLWESRKKVYAFIVRRK